MKDFNKVDNAVENFLNNYCKKTDSFIVAFSGGPDSTALLLSLKKIVPISKLHACYVNHGIRSIQELTLEEKFIDSFCISNNIELIKKQIPYGQIEKQASLNGGIEAYARELRYKLLNEALIEKSATLILTAHNANDFLETMVMHFCNGSGLAGLRGISTLNGSVGRPLIDVQKDDILLYLKNSNQNFSIDSTNDSNDYLRNCVRHTILPEIKKVFPYFGTSIKTSARKLSIDEDALDSLANTLIDKKNNKIICKKYDESHLAIRIRALYKIASNIITSKLSWKLVYAAAISQKHNGILSEGSTVSFCRDDCYIVANVLKRKQVEEKNNFCIFPNKEGLYRIAKNYFCNVYFEEQKETIADNPKTNNNFENGIRLDSFFWPICIRSRQPGDYIKTKAGCKFIDSLFSEMRIESYLRDTIPLVEDLNGIVCVVASCVGLHNVYRQNDSLLPNKNCKQLMIELKGASLSNGI